MTSTDESKLGQMPDPEDRSIFDFEKKKVVKDVRPPFEFISREGEQKKLNELLAKIENKPISQSVRNKLEFLMDKNVFKENVLKNFKNFKNLKKGGKRRTRKSKSRKSKSKSRKRHY